MSQNHIKGLSILMNMKDVGVERTLKQIRGQFKTLSSEMKRSNSDFKYSEKSMQTFAARTKELKRGIDLTEQSMKDISNRLRKMTLEEQRTSAEAEKLRQEYSRQHQALNMYKRQLSSTEKEMKQFDTTTKRSVFSMEKINTILGTMRKQLNIANMSFERAGQSTKSYQNYLNQLSVVMSKHQSAIRVLEARYRTVVREQGAMSKEALDLKQKILQEKQALNVLDKQFKDTTLEAKRFSMEQRTMTMSMSQIREKITSVATALKISASNFRMSGQTAQAYKARISELNNSMKQQQLIVQNLSRQYDYAKRQYGSTSKEAQQLNLKLTEERVKLKELNGQLKETTNAHNRLEMEQKQGISSMSQIRAKMQSFNDTLSLSRSNLTRAGESVKAYDNHLKTLNTNMSQQRTVLRELSTQYKFVAQAQGENSQEARELASAITQQKIKMNELEGEIKQTSVAYKQLAASQQQAQALGATGFGRAIQSVNKYGDSIKNVGMNMRAIGSGALIYMTMPAVAAMGTAIKSSIEWEQALAGVAKTTDMSGAELRKMGNEITAMSNRMPFAATEIAGVAEAAGQLGVKKKDITAFTETMMNMGVATNLTAEEAATEFARFANAAKMPIKDVDRLGATVTALGNSSATTEKEIVEMAQRLAGAGAQAGFSADQIMAISASMSSVGIEAEAGGTAMTQIFNKMTRAVADGGDTLDGFAQTAGVSAKEFADTWENNPSKALSMFVKGLSNTKGGAKGVLKALDEVGIKGIREADTIRRMANNHKVLDDALRTGAKGWKENTALTDEAAIRYETMGSKLKVLKNTFINFLRTIGDAVAPIVSKLADVFTGLFKHLQQTSNFTKIVIAVFGSLAIAIPPLIILTGLLAGGIVNIANAMIMLNKFGGGTGILGGLKKGFTMLLSPITQVATKIPLIGSAMTLLTGPIGIAIAAIVAIGTALVIAYKKSETFRNIVNGAFDAVKRAVQVVGQVFSTVFKGIKAMLTGDFKGGSTILNAILPSFVVASIEMSTRAIRAAFTWVSDGIKKAIDWIKTYFSGLGAFLSGDLIKGTDILNKILPPDIVSNIGYILTNIRELFVNIFNYIKNTAALFSIGMKMLWQQHGDTVKAILGGIFTVVKTIFNAFKVVAMTSLSFVFNNVVKPILGGIANAFKIVFGGLKAIVSNAMTALGSVFRGGLNILVGIIQIFKGIFTLNFSLIWEGIKSIFRGALQIISGLVRGTFGSMLIIIKTSMQLIANVIRTVWSVIKNVIVVTAQAIYNGVKNVFIAMRLIMVTSVRIASQIIRALWAALKSFIVTTTRNIYTSVKNSFNAMKVAISVIFRAISAFVRSIWSAIRKFVVSTARAITTNVRNIFNSLGATIRKIFNSVRNFLISVWRSIRSYVVSVARSLTSNLRSIFNSLNSFIRSLFNKIKKFLISTWRSIKNTVISLVKNMWSSIQRTFNTLNSKTRAIFNGVKNFMVKAWSTIKNKTVGTVKSMWSSIKNTFNNMNNGLKNIIGKIKGHINGMVKSVKGGLNKLIKGVNWVGDKLGMKKLPEIKLHTGTTEPSRKFITNGKINRPTLATVNDKGPGNGTGPNGHREIIRRANGTMFSPKGRNVTMPLNKGDSVLSGRQTQTLQKLGHIPKFSKGTGQKNLWDKTKDIAGKAGKGIANTAHDVKDAAGDGLAKAVELAGKGKEWLGKTVGEVTDWLKKPGKLFEKVMDAFGINLESFGIPKAASLPFNMMKGMFGKLKNAAISLIKEWMEDAAGGVGDASWLFKYPLWQKFGKYTGGLNFNGGNHYGLDFGMPTGTSIKAVAGGKVSRVWNDYGGGKSIEVALGGGLTNWYMHLSKQLVKQGQKVSVGDEIAKSGATGNFVRGAHLHFQLNKNGKPQSNVLEWLKGLGSGSQNKAASKWKDDIKRAAKRMKVSLSGSDINDIIRLIQTESGGNAGVTQQIKDVNSGGNEAQGLLQFTPGTFSGYKLKGHGNIRNGYHQLLAFFNNSAWRGNLSAWKRRMAAGLTGWGPTGSRRFATGGLIKSAGWYNLAEDGHPEWVIPTDPNRRGDAMKLLALAANDIQRNKSSNNKRPTQLSNNSNTVNNDKLLLTIIEQQQQQLNLLMEIAKSNAGIENKNFEPIIDKYEHRSQVFSAIDDYNRQKQRMKRF